MPPYMPKYVVWGHGATPLWYLTYVHTVSLVVTVMHVLIIVVGTVVIVRHMIKCGGMLGLVRSI